MTTESHAFDVYIHCLQKRTFLCFCIHLIESCISGSTVAVKIQLQENACGKGESRVLVVGKDFDHESILCSHVTVDSASIMLEYFSEELSEDDTKLLLKLRQLCL